MKAERLFAAIGGADPKLLERSEKTAHIRAWRVGALAACCAAVLALTVLLPRWGQETVQPPAEDPYAGAAVLQFDGGDVGALHLCRIQTGGAAAPDFALYVNEEIYTTAVEGGAYVIRPRDLLPEEFPVIDLAVMHLPGQAPDQAAAEMALTLAAEYAQVSDPEETEQGLYLRAGNGVAWDDAQAEVTCVSDRQGGTFLLTARYFLEAEEGHGVRFRDMGGTFRVTTSDAALAAPVWMRDLQADTERLMDALFAADLSAVEDLLAADAAVDMPYGEDVSGDVSVAAIDYAPNDGQAPTAAVVSVKHRVSSEEPYDYLTMELSCADGQWLLERAGLER